MPETEIGRLLIDHEVPGEVGQLGDVQVGDLGRFEFGVLPFCVDEFVGDIFDILVTELPLKFLGDSESLEFAVEDLVREFRVILGLLVGDFLDLIEFFRVEGIQVILDEESDWGFFGDEYLEKVEEFVLGMETEKKLLAFGTVDLQVVDQDPGKSKDLEVDIYWGLEVDAEEGQVVEGECDESDDDFTPVLFPDSEKAGVYYLVKVSLSGHYHDLVRLDAVSPVVSGITLFRLLKVDGLVYCL